MNNYDPPRMITGYEALELLRRKQLREKEAAKKCQPGEQSPSTSSNAPLARNGSLKGMRSAIARVIEMVCHRSSTQKKTGQR